MGKRSLVLRTSLSLHECEERIQAALAEQEARAASRFPIFELPTTGAARMLAVWRAARGKGEPGSEAVETIVRGRLSRRKLVLWVQKQVGDVPFGNSFVPCLIATLVEEKDGATILRASMRMHRFVRAFLGSWFAFATILYGGIIYAVLAGWERHGSVWVVLLVAPLLPLGLLGLIGLGRSLSRDSKDRMLQFLRETLDARPMSDGVATGAGRED